MSRQVVIIGAGIGGLAAAMRLSHAGCDVTVLERASAPGGKMRTMPSAVGPVDAGPTVLTLKTVFQELFDTCGTRLEEHVSLDPLDVLARHHWDDGSSLDLFADPAQSVEAIAEFAGPAAARQFQRFHQSTSQLFDAFEGPMMRAPSPSPSDIAPVVLRQPALIQAMAPGLSLAQALALRFTDRRLRQLFGRYATYVGGVPTAAPALLSLIWSAESRGVWAVGGGMFRLAEAMQHVAEAAGARFRFNTEVTRIEQQGGRAVAVHTTEQRKTCDAVVFNGDPRALTLGLLGDETAIPEAAVMPRSLSAFVWAFAAQVTGRPPAHHNVFFSHHPNSEFPQIADDRLPDDPTLYVCAQDRGNAACPEGPERFEIIINGPPRSGFIPNPEEQQTCRETTFARLAQMGLTFDRTPDVKALTTPEQFNKRFPGSDGSLYGRSPHGMMAAFARPTARTDLPGLYLAGGGTHPGAGVPMAATSGQLAADAILTDLASTSRFRRTATRGGISTASPTTDKGRSRSLPSSAPSSHPGIVGVDGAHRKTTSA